MYLGDLGDEREISEAVYPTLRATSALVLIKVLLWSFEMNDLFGGGILG